jgi:hypothetical protein
VSDEASPRNKVEEPQMQVAVIGTRELLRWRPGVAARLGTARTTEWLARNLHAVLAS